MRKMCRCLLAEGNSLWNQGHTCRNPEEFFKKPISVCFIPFYGDVLCRFYNKYLPWFIKTNLLNKQHNEKSKDICRDFLGVSWSYSDNHLIPRVKLFLSFSLKTSLHEAESKIYGLSLIHISEPTRPY